jgi:hypothetical protein
MTIPGQLRRDPKFIYLSEWFTPEEAAHIVLNKIPINQVGYVPSIQVPPGNKGCQGLGPEDGNPSLLDVAGDISAPTVPYDPSAVWRTLPLSTNVLTPGKTSPGSSYPSSGQPVGSSDQALGWIEDNWVMVAGGIGVLLALSMMKR